MTWAFVQEVAFISMSIIVLSKLADFIFDRFRYRRDVRRRLER